MLIRTPISQPTPYPHLVSLSPSSPLSQSLTFPSGCRISPSKSTQLNRLIVGNSFSSPISKVDSYGTVDYEKKPPGVPAWKPIYTKISLLENSGVGCNSVLDEWEKQRRVTKFDLCKLVRELRKFGRYKFALEVYQWMNARPYRYRISSADAAIQLDLVSKVHGGSAAKDYFQSLPKHLVDKRTHGALLNAFAGDLKAEEAESLLLEMKEKGYVKHALTYNVMMTLYRNLDDFEKVYSIVSEMTENKIPFDVYTYNIWISTCAREGSVEKMEAVIEKMTCDLSVMPNWTIYSTIASYYTKLGELEKAEDSLRKMENKISGRDRSPYYYLLSHYANIGKKEEVQRVWETYNSIFPVVTNYGYQTMISSFIRMDDVEEAEKLYKEWFSVKVSYDPRIGNMLLGYYYSRGLSGKAVVLLKEMLDIGKANSRTWEIVAEDHIKQRRVADALSCFQKALSEERWKFWKPEPSNVLSIYELCEQENDEAGKEALLGVLSQLGLLDDEAYTSCLPFLGDSNGGKRSTADLQELQPDL